MELNELTELGALFANAHTVKSQRESDAKEVGQEVTRLEQLLLNAMAEAGLPSFRLSTGQTIYRQTDSYAGVADGHTKEELAEALANEDQFRDLIKPQLNLMSLRARMREIEEAGESLPDVIRQQVKINEVHRVKVRK